MHTYTHAPTHHAHTHIHAHMHACTHTCTHACTHTCTHACTHVRTHARMHVHMYAHMHACTHTCTHACSIHSLQISLVLLCLCMGQVTSLKSQSTRVKHFTQPHMATHSTSKSPQRYAQSANMSKVCLHKQLARQ